MLSLAAACGLTGIAAMAQVAPSPQEVAGFTGLHAAAHQGDHVRIDALAAASAKLDARDGHGRTPLHVATFAKQRDAIRALVKVGANIHALDSDRYDAVTIASVAGDGETLRIHCAGQRGQAPPGHPAFFGGRRRQSAVVGPAWPNAAAVG